MNEGEWANRGSNAALLRALASTSCSKPKPAGLAASSAPAPVSASAAPSALASAPSAAPSAVVDAGPPAYLEPPPAGRAAARCSALPATPAQKTDAGLVGSWTLLHVDKRAQVVSAQPLNPSEYTSECSN